MSQRRRPRAVGTTAVRCHGNPYGFPTGRGAFRLLRARIIRRTLQTVSADNFRDILELPRLERFISVIYRPETERMSHYFHASLPSQFDVVLHYDRTRAVEPLEGTPRWTIGEEVEMPATYPSAL